MRPRYRHQADSKLPSRLPKNPAPSRTIMPVIPRPSALARVAHLTKEESRLVIPRPSAVARAAHFWKEKSPPVCLRPSAVARVAHLAEEVSGPMIPRPSAVARVAHFTEEKSPPVCPRPSAVARIAHWTEVESGTMIPPIMLVSARSLTTSDRAPDKRSTTGRAQFRWSSVRCSRFSSAQVSDRLSSGSPQKAELLATVGRRRSATSHSPGLSSRP